MKITKEIRNEIAAEVLGSGYGPIDLTALGERLGFTDDVCDDIDLQVAIIAEQEGVWNCQVCGWWCEEAEMHNEICNDCYQEDDDV